MFSFLHSKLTLIVLIVTFPCVLLSQRDVTTEMINTPYIGIHYGGNLPGGDFAERFGYTNHLGGIFGYKTNMNWIFGIDGNFMFSNSVREEQLLSNVMDSQGTITNTSGEPAIVVPMLRGFNVNGVFGYIFPNTGHNPNSGVMFMLGGGYLWHKIRIESQDDEVPQIENEYLEGYDRLTIGFNTSQFFGYNYMANKGIFNFYFGAYFQQGFTYNQRTMFWDRPDYEVPTNRRTEYQYGLRIGWMIPVYKREAKEFYYD